MIIAGNWKMNKTPHQAQRFIMEMRSKISEEDQKSFIFLVSALLFGALNKIFIESSFCWGGQNCYVTGHGSFTGENSPQIMKQMGATHCLVGHSERRTLFFEDNALIQKKLKAVLDFQMTPILCVGENLKQKEEGKTRSVLASQLQAVDDPSSTIIAYEPLWAIGTGQTADTPSIVAAIQTIHDILGHNQVCVLYGGSVNEQEVPRLCSIKGQGLGGFLVGTKSLDFSSFFDIYKQVKNYQK